MKKLFPYLSILAIGVFFFGLVWSDPFGTKTSGSTETDAIQPTVPYTNAVVKYADSLNGLNDTTALKTRGYKLRRGATHGPIGTTYWFQGNSGVFAAFEGPATGYVGANFNATTGANNIDLWLILPNLNVAAGDTISFYERSPAASGFPDSIRVHYASNGDTNASTGSWVELGKFKTTTTGSWTERRFVAPTAGANGRFAINYRVVSGGPSGANSDFIGIDLIRVLGPAPAANTTLVLMHDSVNATSTAKRKADRDSMRVYLSGLVGGYDLVTFDTNSALPSLAGYDRIIVQETSFDAIGCRYLGATARNNLTAWLNSGTPAARKTLIMIGADLGYNYSRANTGQDLNFAGQMLGIVYRLDNADPTPGTLVGERIDAGNSRNIASPVDAGYYPDGCGLSNGSYPLYRWVNQTVNDTLAAIGRYTANYEVRSMFADPRYFTGGSLLPTLTALINGALTAVNPLNNEVPMVYSLSQNYPNPFNPVTNIKFSIPAAGNVKLVIFDILGREVKTLLNDVKPAGNYVVDFNAAELSSGAYFYRLESGNFVETKKMLLVK